VKFAHLSDVHLGGWREPKMRAINQQSFDFAIQKCLSENVDFVLLSGDLFNTSMPPVDCLKHSVQKFKELRAAGIPVYLIPGSHDFSPSGKTMLDVLEEAGMFINVVKGDVETGKLRLKFTVDPKTGAKITGMLGKKGGLERTYYEDLDHAHLEAEQGTKIFLFHSALQEIKPKELAEMDAMSVSFLPKGFDYYAGGHVHVVDKASLEARQNIIYPGPVFPNNFAELEKLRHGSFVIYDNGTVTHVPLAVRQTVCITADAEGKTPSEVEEDLRNTLKGSDVENAIVTIRITGQLSQGRPSDVNLNDAIQHAYDLGAHIVMKNTNGLASKEFEQVTVVQHSIEDIEDALVREHTGKNSPFPLEREREIIRALLDTLAMEKNEGEKSADFEKRVIADAQKLVS